MAKGKLFVISGPSGVGKGTICKEILKRDSGIKMSVSMTTRSPRSGEIDKVHYYFVDRKEFQELIDKKGFMEYANVYGNFYGTPKKQVMEWLDQGTDVILEIDVQGAMQIKKNHPEGVFIFILPPSIEELKRRIAERGSETEETALRRLNAAVEEISFVDQYDYSVENGDLEQAVERVGAVIEAERCRVDKDAAAGIVDRYKEES